jgi:beta-glucosidase
VPNSLSRRDLAKTLGLASASLAMPRIGHALAPHGAAISTPATHAFPPDFLWGCSTASYQVEGAYKADGRGMSIWDTFSHTPGKVFDNENGDVADDFYHRYHDDLALQKNTIGARGFRFSIAWPRIFPEGTGTPNMQGVDFYDRLVDAMLAQGIVPFCTLYHWDLPQPLEDKGGWQNRDTAKAFGDYAGYIAGRLSDRVRHFMTVNELSTFVELGYRLGTHAPGLQLDMRGVAQVRHHAVLGHGLAVQALRAHCKPGTQVGIADNLTLTIPAIETPEHIAAARKALREENAMYLTVIEEGRYTDQYLARLGADAPKFTAEDLRIISSPLDFVGINVYQPVYVRADDSAQGYAILTNPESYPHMYSPWLNLGPEGLYWAPKLVHDIWGVQMMYITENGTSSADVVAPDGHIYDTDRIMFLRNYLTQLQRATSEGVPVKGYFLWSLLDNFEWADGYSKRFGIVYVDYKTQQRIPKLSASFYAAVIRANALR